MKFYASIAEAFIEIRAKQKRSQDEFGARHEVIGPTIFKIEKGYASPSLNLWMKIAKDGDISERHAVLLWLKGKLPDQYHQYIELPAPRPKARKGAKVDYSRFDSASEMREAAGKDKTLPKALRDLLADDELWELFRPVGHEINLLRDTFGALGEGSKSGYREALRLIREFSHSF